MRRIAIVLLALVTGACGAPDATSVDGAWVRLPAVPRGPAAGYFTIHGGPADMTLISVVCENAIRAEMHESMAVPSTGSGRGMGGMTTMKPLGQLAVPAHAEVAFKPGGRHVMLFDLNPAIKPPRGVKLLLTFSNGTRITAVATTVAAGAPAPE